MNTLTFRISLVSSFFAVFILFSLNGCVKDRIEDIIPPLDTTVVDITPGVLKINEIQAAGNVNQDEFGQLSDWIEIYNPNLEAVTMTQGRWWITDDAFSNPKKYQIPITVTIPPLGFLLIWANNKDTYVTQIHTNFALSSAGEDVGLYYEDNQGNLIEIDQYSYPAQQSGTSIGRFPDGTPNWQVFSIPTPGQPNN